MAQITITRDSQLWDAAVFHAALRAAFAEVEGVSNSADEITVWYADSAAAETPSLVYDWVMTYQPSVAPTELDVVTVRTLLGDVIADAVESGSASTTEQALIAVIVQQQQTIAALQSVGG